MRTDDLWYGDSLLSIALAPLGFLYGGIMCGRRALYRAGVLRSVRVAAPVIVVGNLAVGGTGKTPLVIWLVDLLRRAGKRPGVVSRGYGGTPADYARAVTAASDPREVGDEPVLIALRAGCPVVVDANRVRAANNLLATHECDVIVADDGLQHYALARDVEIAVVDALRRHGNGRCLPAGPLREPLARLAAVDLVMINGGGAGDECGFTLRGEHVHSFDTAQPPRALSDFAGRRVHAVAGIGRPARFFEHLRARGVQVIEHAFPDHYAYDAADIRFGDGLPVLMTEKDAVKCRGFTDALHGYLPVSAELEAGCERQLREVLKRRLAIATL